jgi:hypothetical protein
MNRIASFLLCPVLALHAGLAAASQQPETLTRELRGVLEDQFRASTGLGFSDFHCDLPHDTPPARELTCNATDEEGDVFHYRIVADHPEDPPRVSMSQPVSQLDPAGLASIEEPCIAFLEAFERAQWPAAHERLAPNLKSQLPVADLEASLAPMRELFGETSTIQARIYSTPDPGLHQLEYAVEAANGSAVARFQLQFIDDSEARIVAFLLSAEPGSELQGRLLTANGKNALSRLLERTVVDVRGPLHELELIGDAIEAEAVIDDGSSIAVWIGQHGSAHDLDGNDYSFRILDVPTIVHRHLASTGSAPRQVDCPQRVVPDGSRIDCTVVRTDGSERPVSILRRGGDHRLVEPEQ